MANPEIVKLLTRRNWKLCYAQPNNVSSSRERHRP